MLALAYILLALAVACAVYQRARRKAAEWDRDDARAEADLLGRTIDSCRLHTRQAIDERDDARRELETARLTTGVREGDLTQRNRALRDCIRDYGLAAAETIAMAEATLAAARKISRPSPVPES